MMEKFFDDKFKNLQKQQNNAGRTMAKVGDISHHVKSPSDTTIYAPALQKKLMPVGVINTALSFGEETDPRVIQQNDHTEEITQDLNNLMRTSDVNASNRSNVQNFVEAVRMQDHPEDIQSRRRLGNQEELEMARNKAEKTILEAEKFHAVVEPPPGNNCNISPNLQFDQILNIGSGVSDDDFFHLTCHIEPNLIHKIEKGEFIELEKLLPKDKLGGQGTEENRLEWVQKDGGTLLVPAQRDNKIGGFRRWEQAFRAYATIYCGANPHRAKEIWQYITVINTTASSYAWDNVYDYDITFRHLMAFNPQRSWAVTYNQMWNLSMKDLIPRNNRGGMGHSQYSGTTGHGSGRNFSNNASSNPMQVRRNKSDYCWNFNKGVPCKFGEGVNLWKGVSAVTHQLME